MVLNQSAWVFALGYFLKGNNYCFMLSNSFIRSLSLQLIYIFTGTIYDLLSEKPEQEQVS